MASSCRNPLTKVTLQQCFRHSLEAHSANLKQPPSYLVAFSGGVDSHVLLHLCVSLGLAVRAIHIHHGLQQQADDWENHCLSVCENLDVSMQSVRVDATAKKGESPEAAARDARYQALNNALESDEILLLGQHKNDQAETVLLQLLRGGGAAGLSAMSQQSLTSDGNVILRPMLQVTRKQIENYAVEHKLWWVEDPSNQDVSYKRNALRQQVLPLIEQHWPDAVSQLTHVAEQQQHSRLLIDELARADLANAVSHTPQQLVLSSMLQLSVERQFNVLRYWLHALQTRPNKNCISQVIETVLHAAADSEPVVHWSGFEVRRFENTLYLLQVNESCSQTEQFIWKPQSPMMLQNLNAELSAVSDVDAGLKLSLLEKELQVRFRSGGEQIQLQGKSHHQALKKLLQQASVPPWQRQRIPLIFDDDELIAVCGYWRAEKYCVGENEKGWEPRMIKNSEE